ncbi:MAG: CsbD family protein [Azoarcus sp.]|nr:CsbD family protein [Azoarcus sp.]
MNKDQVKGRIDEAAGGVTEATGKLVGDDELESKGVVRKWSGKIRSKVGDLRNRFSKKGD